LSCQQGAWLLYAGKVQTVSAQVNLRYTDSLLGNIRSNEPNKWVVWLVGHLPREQVNTAIAQLQQKSPELHYAVTLIWSFLDSWIAKHWELNPTARFPAD
jgi:hypothetical protein